MARRRKSVNDITSQYYRLGSKTGFDVNDPRYQKISRAWIKYRENIQNSDQYKKVKQNAYRNPKYPFSEAQLSSQGREQWRRDLADAKANKVKVSRSTYMGLANTAG